ncbi:DUF218 domain [Nocardia otitidiscaviarum]|uniref:DUF218 domain n=1 Tax=Nocardia otitidiscaviarum TaxID=1823 RepID=A0A379JHW6_9NOCA|nr:YdcF family protein [Nocardia otitidiscaviarum]SUD48065.1 DUF218 domain [Nocardia otitidiscaviarum]
MFDQFLPPVPTLRHAARAVARLVVTGAAVTALALTAAPAFAEPAAAPAHPSTGITDEVLAAIDSVTTLRLPGLELPALFTPNTAIVVLGYGLLPDGSMRPELINRLHAGYVSAVLSPAAPVIVTGGNPRNGVPEAAAMAEWLIARGIPPQRIHVETQANSTVQNAAFSAKVMAAIGATTAILITSADHIGRALSNFQAAGISVVATMTPDETPLSAHPFGPGQ